MERARPSALDADREVAGDAHVGEDRASPTVDGPPEHGEHRRDSRRSNFDRSWAGAAFDPTASSGWRSATDARPSRSSARSSVSVVSSADVERVAGPDHHIELADRSSRDRGELDEVVADEESAPVGERARVRQRIVARARRRGRAQPATAPVATSIEVLGEHLADLVARELVDRHVADRHLVRGEVLAAQQRRARSSVGIRAPAVGTTNADGHLAEPVVGHADHGGVGDAGCSQQHLVDLRRERPSARRG